MSADPCSTALPADTQCSDLPGYDGETNGGGGDDVPTDDNVGGDGGGDVPTDDTDGGGDVPTDDNEGDGDGGGDVPSNRR